MKNFFRVSCEGARDGWRLQLSMKAHTSFPFLFSVEKNREPCKIGRIPDAVHIVPHPTAEFNLFAKVMEQADWLPFVFSTEERRGGFSFCCLLGGWGHPSRAPMPDARRMAHPVQLWHAARSCLLYITLGSRAASRGPDCSAGDSEMKLTVRAYATFIIQFGSKMYFLGFKENQQGTKTK